MSMLPVSLFAPLRLNVFRVFILAVLLLGAALPCSAQESFREVSVHNFSQVLFELWQQKTTVRLSSAAAKTQGFKPLMNRDFFGQGKAGESLEWASPVAGTYYIALVMHDSSAGVEKLNISVGEQSVGQVVADRPRSGQVLFVSPQPVDLRRGDAIRMVSADGSAQSTFGNVCLLAENPEVPPLVIENLSASHRHGQLLTGTSQPSGSEPNDTVMIAWTTNRPASGSVRIGEQVIDEDRGLVNNHRVFVPREQIAGFASVEIHSTEEFEHQTVKSELVVHADPVEHFRHHGGELPEGKVTRVELRVVEPTEAGRQSWPVSSGVPLPMGTLVDVTKCRLLDAAGDEVTAQFTPLAWYADGVHVRWLLVDFLADTAKRTDTDKDEAAKYTLECGTSPQKSEPVASGKPAFVETGSFDKGFAPLANVSFGGRKLTTAEIRRCGFEVTDGEGKVYSSAQLQPEEVVVEDAGPVRTTVRVRGQLADTEGNTYARYLCRLHFHANRPTVRVVFSLDNDVAEPEMNLFGSLKVCIPMSAAGESASGSRESVKTIVGVDGHSRTLAAGHRLLQDEDYRFVVQSAGEASAAAASPQETKADGRRADGWLLVPGQLAVHVRDFWQLYPKGFTVEDDAIVLELMPSLPAEQYAGCSDDDLTKLYFWNDQGRYKLRTGVRLTTEFVVDFDPQEEDGLYADASRWQQPLFAACTPEWYCESGAFGPMVPRRAGRFDVYEKNLDSAFAKFVGRRETIREYGFMNFGDWFGERKHNWGNIEYDTQWALAANFARTGNLDMLRRAVEAESHNADVDTKHYGPGAGDVWVHSTGHTGGYFPRKWKNMKLFNEGASGTGHTWCRGHFVLYGLTGERRYLETGRKIADRLAGGTTDFYYYAERNIGWPIVALMGAHGTTSNPFYLNGAKLMADTAMWTQSPDTGGWGHWIDTNECRHADRCWGCKTFMTGVLLHGLKLYDLAQPRDDMRRTIVKNCDFIWRTCYVPRDQGFIYSECLSRRNSGRPGTFCIVGDGLAYGCRLDPTHRHRESLRHAAMSYFYNNSVGDFGKQITNATCFVPLMLHDLDALGLSRYPAGRESKPAE